MHLYMSVKMYINEKLIIISCLNLFITTRIQQVETWPIFDYIGYFPSMRSLLGYPNITLLLLPGTL